MPNGLACKHAPEGRTSDQPLAVSVRVLVLVLVMRRKGDLFHRMS